MLEYERRNDFKYEKNDNHLISENLIEQLPQYHRYLKKVLGRVDRIALQELCFRTGFSASQVRQDLNSFTSNNGDSYEVNNLYNQISKILGLDKTYSAVVIGAGNLGQAIYGYCCDNQYINIKGIFDVNTRIEGIRIDSCEVLNIVCLEDYLKDNNIDIAIVCAPVEAVDITYKILKVSSIRGIWNFSDVEIKSTDRIVVENVRLSDSLEMLTYYINNQVE